MAGQVLSGLQRRLPQGFGGEWAASLVFNKGEISCCAPAKTIGTIEKPM